MTALLATYGNEARRANNDPKEAMLWHGMQNQSTLSPLAKNADVFFAVPEHEYTFSRSLAAPMCLAQAITVALAGRLQDNNKDPRIPTVTGPDHD